MKLFFVATFFALICCSCGSAPSEAESKPACKDFVVLQDNGRFKNILVADITEADAKCIASQLYSTDFRVQTFMFFKFKDDYQNHVWKYKIQYDADKKESDPGVFKDEKGRLFIINDFAKMDE
ncbi:hypothetical protein [Pinibacter soli]|uniref:Lipoprotein n=1 Tax=Pinibacter soli TaxID=3044211 RepID=A0ABT6RBQ9_9BACT|nr:hypothetical protein [Pinibacter soli]MDI3319960.1 hypothetical protein [Pinibacter soli]